jgi:hypothetical protein
MAIPMMPISCGKLEGYFAVTNIVSRNAITAMDRILVFIPRNNNTQTAISTIPRI